MAENTQTQHEFKLPVPGIPHCRLEPFVGKFRARVKIWTGQGDPMESTGTMINQFQLGGLYLHQDYVGDACGGPFPSFAGKGYWGFNPSQEHYEGFWIDNASSMFQIETGQVDKAGKVWTMHSVLNHPASGRPMNRRTVITIIDNNHHRMESYVTMDGSPEQKNMEIDYQRVSSAEAAR